MLLAVLSPAHALTLKGTAVDAGGNPVRVVVRVDRGQPKIVDLDYAPVRVPSNHSETFASPTTYNGVDGSEYIELDNQSETVTSHLRFFDLKRPETGDALKQMQGKCARNELATIQWSGMTTYFTPSDGGATIVSGSTSIPQSESENYRRKETATGQIDLSTERRLSWSFSSEATSSSSSILMVRIALNQVSPKKWRIRISTERWYLDLDSWLTFRTIERGYLRAR